jgi:hypothetical protein
MQAEASRARAANDDRRARKLDLGHALYGPLRIAARVSVIDPVHEQHTPRPMNR